MKMNNLNSSSQKREIGRYLPSNEFNWDNTGITLDTPKEKVADIIAERMLESVRKQLKK